MVSKLERGRELSKVEYRLDKGLRDGEMGTRPFGAGTTKLRGLEYDNFEKP